MRYGTGLALLLALGSTAFVSTATSCSRSSCENLLETLGAFDESDFDDIDDFDDLDDLDADFNDLIDDDDLSDDAEDFCEDLFD